MNNTFATRIACLTEGKRLSLSVLFRQFGTAKRVGSAKRIKVALSKAFADKLASTTKQFDNVLGIAEVRAAQSIVQGAEEEFMKSRRSVQDRRTELALLQSQLRELRGKLDRIPREDERYLKLATEEHKVLIEERKVKVDLEGLALLERDNFAALSAAVRNAHEKERSRAERTKYWSIIGSACGAVLGILGSTIINIKRMKQIKLTVQENNQVFMANTMQELKMILLQSERQTRLMPVAEDKRENASVTPVLQVQNSELSGELAGKLEKPDWNSITESLASAIQELKQELSEKRFSGDQEQFLESPSTFLHFERRLHDVSWWSKASIAASIAGVSCSLILYTFYR